MTPPEEMDMDAVYAELYRNGWRSALRYYDSVPLILWEHDQHPSLRQRTGEELQDFHRRALSHARTVQGGCPCRAEDRHTQGRRGDSMSSDIASQLKAHMLRTHNVNDWPGTWLVERDDRGRWSVHCRAGEGNQYRVTVTEEDLHTEALNRR